MVNGKGGENKLRKRKRMQCEKIRERKRGRNAGGAGKTRIENWKQNEAIQ